MSPNRKCCCSSKLASMVACCLLLQCLFIEPCQGSIKEAVAATIKAHVNSTTTKHTTTTTLQPLLTTSLPIPTTTLVARYINLTDDRVHRYDPRGVEDNNDTLFAPLASQIGGGANNKMIYTTTTTSNSNSFAPSTDHDADLYTVQLPQQPSLPQRPRQSKHDTITMKPESYDYKCPKQHYIHPCDCLELDKRYEMMEGSGDSNPASVTPTVEMIEEEEPINPDLMETVAFCKNIINTEVLTEALKGFQGHRINYFVLDGCKLPPFPNNLFQNIQIVWMEILNSTLKFENNYFQTHSCP